MQEIIMMQDINRTMNYVVEQRILRKLSSAGEEMPVGAKKDPLLMISSRVNNCLEVFDELPRAEKRRIIPDVKLIIENFNKILETEDAEVKKGFQATLHKISNSLFKPLKQKTMLQRSPQLEWSPQLAEEMGEKSGKSKVEKLKKGEVSDAQFEEHAMNDCSKEIAKHLLGPFLRVYEPKNFVYAALENLDKNLKKEISIGDITTELINTASKEYAPLQMFAGDKFTEEEMADINTQKIYDKAEELNAAKDNAINRGRGIFTEEKFLDVRKVYVNIYELKNIKKKYQEKINMSNPTHNQLQKLKKIDDNLIKLESAKKQYIKIAKIKCNLQEEEMLDVSEICYQANKYNQEKNYGYEDYDHVLLNACIKAFKSGAPWQELPLVRYRLGNSKEDFKKFNIAIENLRTKDGQPTSPSVELKLGEWNMARLR